jgi:hypothetical protein
LKNNRILEKKMTRFRKMVVLSLAIAGLLVAGTAAKADSLITLTLDSPYQVGAGPMFDFNGTITNTSDQVVYLNGDGFPVLDSGLTADDGGFNVNAPGSLNPGQSSGDILLFTMTAPPYGPGSNFYAGTYAIYGGYGDSDSNLLAAENFNVQVTPEPSSLSLLGVGLFAGLVWLGGVPRRRQVSRVA